MKFVSGLISFRNSDGNLVSQVTQVLIGWKRSSNFSPKPDLSDAGLREFPNYFSIQSGNWLSRSIVDLMQAERFECCIDMFEMNVERTKLVDLQW